MYCPSTMGASAIDPMRRHTVLRFLYVCMLALCFVTPGVFAQRHLAFSVQPSSGQNINGGSQFNITVRVEKAAGQYVNTNATIKLQIGSAGGPGVPGNAVLLVSDDTGLQHSNSDRICKSVVWLQQCPYAVHYFLR